MSVNILPRFNSTSTGNIPLSLQLLEGASNKCWEKFLICSVKFHQQSSVSWISRINIMKCFIGKCHTNVEYNKTSHCLACTVQNIKIHFTFTLLQQSFLCQLHYSAVCMSVLDCTTGVQSLQTVCFVLIAMEIWIIINFMHLLTWQYTYLQYLFKNSNQGFWQFFQGICGRRYKQHGTE